MSNLLPVAWARRSVLVRGRVWPLSSRAMVDWLVPIRAASSAWDSLARNRALTGSAEISNSGASASPMVHLLSYKSMRNHCSGLIAPRFCFSDMHEVIEKKPHARSGGDLERGAKNKNARITRTYIE